MSQVLKGDVGAVRTSKNKYIKLSNCCAAIVQWFLPQVYNQYVPGLNPTSVLYLKFICTSPFESVVSSRFFD